MCTPEAMVLMTLATTVQASKAANAEGQYKSSVAKYNARVAENTAQAVRNKGTEAENLQRLKTAQLLSKQRAQLGASNVSLDSGTALQLQQDTVALGEADALRIRSNTEFKTESLLTKSKLLESQSQAEIAAGRNRATGSLLKGATTLVSAGVADKWFSPNSAANAAPGDAFQPAFSYT